MQVNIVMYHYVRNLTRSRFPGIKGLDTVLFRKQLEFLKSNYSIVRMEDMISALSGGAKLPSNAALLTFDDGYIDHYTTVFPLLDSMGIQGSFFRPSMVLEDACLLDVNKIHFILGGGNEVQIYESLIREIDFHRGTEFEIEDTYTLINKYAKASRFDDEKVVFIKQMLQTILPKRLRELITSKLFKQFVGVDEAVFSGELYCNTEQLLAMKRHGMFIGLHGSKHEWLGNLGENEAKEDIIHAIDFMDSAGLIDRKSWVMCYPFGSLNNSVVEFVRSNGGVAGLTTKVGYADLQRDDSLLLPRFDTNDFPPKSNEYMKY